jgi:hypothetical protein
MRTSRLVIVANLVHLMATSGASVAALAKNAGLAEMTITKARMGIPVKKNTADLIHQTLNERTFVKGTPGRKPRT